MNAVIGELQNKFPLTVDQYVIMPNHIHLIVTVKDCDEIRAIRESPLQKRSIISRVVGYLKMNATKQIHSFMSGAIFQRSFYDHVIRNEHEYAEISKYIAKNPQTWREDSLYG
ncbi:MAG: transposase [Clostridia bacterium]|nr:transposase [Clostridia bacterium]